MKENHSLSLALINLYLFLCRHLLINSVRLFSRASSFAVKIAYFSASQNLALNSVSHSPSCFKFSFAQSDIVLGLIFGLYSCFYNHNHSFNYSSITFKPSFYNQNHSLNSDSKRNATELSKFIWSCKDSDINPAISWKIVCHATPYQHGGKVCNLWLAEKYAILTANDDALLNKRTEWINKCRHKNKYKLINAKLKLWFSFIFLIFFFFTVYNVLP